MPRLTDTSPGWVPSPRVQGMLRGGGLTTISSGCYQRVLAVQPGNLIAFWPLWETAGATADNLEGTAARDGTYGGVTLADKKINAYYAPYFDGVNGFVDVYSASLASVFNGREGTALLWSQVHDIGVYTDGATRFLLYIRKDGNNFLLIKRGPLDNNHIVQYKANGVSLAPVVRRAVLNPQMWTITWSQSGDELKVFLNGSQDGATLNGLGAWTVGATLDSDRCVIGAADSITPASPYYGWESFGALWDTPLSDSQIASLHSCLNPCGFFAVGDSKTEDDMWVHYVPDGIETATGTRWIEQPGNFGVGGATVATMKAYIDANLGAVTDRASAIVINLGVNDVPAMPAEADWKTNYTSIIDSLRAKWVGIPIYLAKVWRRNFGAECNTLAGWIDDIVALYSSGVAVGMDERIWLENGDNGATYTTDGIHYNTAAQWPCANAWLAGMGY